MDKCLSVVDNPSRVALEMVSKSWKRHAIC